MTCPPKQVAAGDPGERVAGMKSSGCRSSLAIATFSVPATAIPARTCALTVCIDVRGSKTVAVRGRSGEDGAPACLEAEVECGISARPERVIAKHRARYSRATNFRDFHLR